MEARFITREQATALGWTPLCACGLCDGPHRIWFGPGFDTVREGEFGSTVEIPVRWDGESFEDERSGWLVRPEMLQVGRVLTQEEVDANRVDTERGVGFRPEMIRDYGGTYLPLDLGTYIPHREGASLRAVGWSWQEYMFHPSPIVQLIFRRDTDTGADVTDSGDRGTGADEGALPPAAIAFRDASLKDARRMVTCGFELETQSTEGCSYDDPGEVDIDSYEAAVAEEVHYRVGCSLSYIYINKEYLPDYLSNLSDEKLREVLEALEAGSFSDLHKKGVIADDTYEDIMSATEEFVRRYVVEESDHCVSHKDLFDLPSTLQVGSDSSVEGFEFRTLGGLTTRQFESAAVRLFSLNHDIDTGCSFHIHLAVKGVRHSSGINMQRALTEYLIENIDRVPASVRERWERVDEVGYYQPRLEAREKYSFVWRHHQGTWEFRCFGNIHNAEDAKICLNLAIEAMQHAYRVVSGQEQHITDRLNLSQEFSWKELMVQAMIEGTSLSQFALREAA